jgi:hypothetical protein
MANWVLYNSFAEELLMGEHAFETDTFKLVLTTSSYTPATSHTTMTDVGATQVTGTNYAVKTLDDLAVVLDGSTATWSATNVSYAQSAAGFDDAKHAVIYNDDTTGDKLIAYATFTTEKGNVDGDLTLDIDAGILDAAIA